MNNNENNGGNNNDRKNESKLFEAILAKAYAEMCVAEYDAQLEQDGDYRRTTRIYELLSITETQGPALVTTITAQVVRQHKNDYKVMTDLLMALKYKQRYFSTVAKDYPEDVPHNMLAAEYKTVFELVHDEITNTFAENDEAMNYITNALYE